MIYPPHRLCLPALVMCGLFTAASVARADAAGFGNFSQFTVNQNDGGSPPTVPVTGTIQLTNGGSEIRSIFTQTPQNITQFTASFTLQITQASANVFPGVAFVIENDPRGASAVGNSASAFGFQGITNSVGITLDEGHDTAGLFTNGNIGSGAINISPVNLGSGDPINIQLTYSGSSLTETFFDTVTSASFSTTDLVLTSIPTTVGGNTAYVGFGAGSGTGGNEFFSNFQFTSGSSVPEPASISLVALAAVPLLVRRRRR